MKKIYVSEELISRYGKHYFSGDSYDTYKKFLVKKRSEEGFMIKAEPNSIYLYYKTEKERCIAI